MLLGRVIEHVREQNLTAIGIDFVIVVTGVFVAIQMSNWNEDRENRKRGAEFTGRLRTGLGRACRPRGAPVVGLNGACCGARNPC